MTTPLVTIVTPSFNQGKFIRATIESVLNQDYPAIEYIVMDGGSTDATVSVVNEFSGKLTFISERDRGQSHAINKGFRMARGEIVSWLNSDDIILPGAVSRAVSTMTQDPSLGAVYGEGYRIDREGNVIGRFEATEPFNLWKLVYLSDYILQQTTYFRRAVLDDVGDVDEQLNWGMDWDLLMRIGMKYPIAYIPEYMGSIREYETAKTFSGGFRRIWELAGIMRRHGQGKFPPGMFTYGLDTLHRRLLDWFPLPFVQRALNPLFGRAINKILRDSQGLYHDRWAAPRLRYMLPAGRGSIEICGVLPADILELKGQAISVQCDSKIIYEQLLAPGEFRIKFDDPMSGTGLPATFNVMASRSFIPSRSGLGPDHRHLSYMVTEIHRCVD